MKRLGRKPLPDGEVKRSITIKLKEYILDNLNKQGNARKIIEEEISEKYGKK